MGKFLAVTQDGPVATLSFQSEKGINILSGPVLKELQDVWSELETKNQTRVCIIRGEGKVFIAGADIKEMAKLTGPEAEKFAACGQSIFNQIENSNIISIAAMHGAALGGGCELALACDIRIAATGLKIGQPEVNLGLIPGFGGTQRLPRIVGQGNALDMILTGAILSAEEALRIGLVSKVVTAEELLECAKKYAKTITAKGPTAVTLAKHAIKKIRDSFQDNGLTFEQKSFAKSFENGEGLEGMTAFIEKRKPNFQ